MVTIIDVEQGVWCQRSLTNVHSAPQTVLHLILYKSATVFTWRVPQLKSHHALIAIFCAGRNTPQISCSQKACFCEPLRFCTFCIDSVLCTKCLFYSFATIMCVIEKGELLYCCARYRGFYVKMRIIYKEIQTLVNKSPALTLFCPDFASLNCILYMNDIANIETHDISHESVALHK